MVGAAVDRLCGEEIDADGVRILNGTDPDCAIEVASALTFTGGFLQVNEHSKPVTPAWLMLCTDGHEFSSSWFCRHLLIGADDSRLHDGMLIPRLYQSDESHLRRQHSQAQRSFQDHLCKRIDDQRKLTI
jgi:hypothetical protein